MRTTALQQLLEEDGVQIPKGTGSERMVLCFFHNEKDPSMSVNIAEGLYFCHGCTASGNAYTYLTEKRGYSPDEAWAKLEKYGYTPDNLKHHQKKHKSDKEERERTRKGLPKVAKEPYKTLGRKDNKLKLAATYHYLRPDDPSEKTVIVQRWHEVIKGKDGNRVKKTFISYTPRAEGGYWVAAPNNDNLPPEDRISPIPLYGIQDVWPLIEAQKKKPDAAKKQIWIVEGEKCRDALVNLKERTLPLVVSPYGGSNKSIESMDWSPLFGQRVVLLADSDKTGRKCMRAIGKYLAQHGTECRYFLPRGESHYDVFDALQDGGWEFMMAWINDHGGVISHEEAHPVDEEPKIEAPPLHDCQYFTVLGYHGDDIIIQSRKTHHLHRIPAKSMHSEGNLIHLAPLEFWKSLAPNRQLTAAVRAMWADKIVRAAEDGGAISVDNLKIYGRGGAITDAGEIMYNVGNCLLTEDDSGLLTCRKPLSILGQGREVYEPGPSVELSDHAEAAKWADEMASAVLRYRWEKVEHGKLFLGWIVTSLIGGALNFRPVIWMVGDAGTGKTFLLEKVLKKLMGPMLTDVGSGSEAGLASMARSSSLPFCIDEFEPEKGKEEAITKTLNLMRMASGGDSARLRGTATGGASMHRPRFSLLVCSINKPELDSASASRIVPIRLSATPVANWPNVRDSIHAALENERAPAIRTYIIRNTAIVARKAREIEDKLIARGIDTRMAKTQSALTAGYWLLSGQESEVAIKKRKETDNYAPLRDMISQFIRVDNKEMTFAECLYLAYFTEDGMWIDMASGETKELREACKRYGFWFVKEDEMQMALNLGTARQLLVKTKHMNIDVDDYIESLPGVERLHTESGNPKRVRVGGVQKPVVRIPKEIIQKLGLSVEDDDITPDGNEKDEDIPF